MKDKFFMKEYFGSPEMKISSAILITIGVLFLIVTITFEKLNYDNLKDSYSKNMGAITLIIILFLFNYIQYGFLR